MSNSEIEPGIMYADLKYPTRQQMRLEIARLIEVLESIADDSDVPSPDGAIRAGWAQEAIAPYAKK